MANLDDRTTALTLMLLRKAHLQGINLSAVTMDSVNAALAEGIESMEQGQGPAFAVLQQVQRLVARSAADRSLPTVFLFPDPDHVWLNPAFLDEAQVDYTGDGIPDTTVDAFLWTLDAAAETFALTGCEAGSRITVVFQLDLNTGNRDLNCNPLNPFKFAKQASGNKVFLTGAIFTSDPATATPTCEAGKRTDCLTQDEKTEINQALGNWVPNQVGLRDDGQAGDAVPGDGIWTGVFTLPYIPLESLPSGSRGVRLGYKYTFGLPGQGWTSTEEWPGNNRIFELKDLNGDGMIVRYDYFGDETSNKNMSNNNRGLCGSSRNPWPENVVAGCFMDVHENRIDTNGDCAPDTFASPGSVSPSCEGSTAETVKDLGYGFRTPAAAPGISGLVPSTTWNGGGELMTLRGTNLHPGLSVQVNTAATMDVANNELPGFLTPDPGRLLFLAPPFPPAGGLVVVAYSAEVEGGGTTTESVTAPVLYQVTKTVPAGMVYPESMPLAGHEATIPAGTQGHPTALVLARLAVEDPGSVAGLRVELGLSPPCCQDGDVCLAPFGPCYALPDPRFQEGWTYAPMIHDPGCRVPPESGLQACADVSTGQDVSQFQGALVPTIERARYRYLVRYSFDHGRSWEYVDFAQGEETWGSTDGFRLGHTGLLWVR
jgi:hypothetical protein